MYDLKARILSSANARAIAVGGTLHVLPATAQAHRTAGSKLAAGHYLVTGIQVDAVNRTASLRLRALNERNCIDMETPAQSVTFTAAFLAQHFGAASIKVARSGQMINELFKFQLAKGGKGALYDKSFDYDKLFAGLAGKYFRKSPVNLDAEDKTDLIVDVLNQILTPATVKALDADRDPIKYFGGMFEMRMQSAMRDWVTRRLREVKNQNSEMTDDEFFDHMDDRKHSLFDQVHFVDMVKQLSKFLAAKPEGKYYVPMFAMLQQGYSNTEVAKELNVSPAIVTRYLQRMKDAILEFAKKTNNSLLFDLMSEYLGKRKHSDDTAAGNKDFLIDVLKQYKKRVGSDQDRNPAGQVLTIALTKEDDVFSDSVLADIAMDPSVTNDQLVHQAEEFLEYLASQDDLVEQADSVIGLRYVSDDVRPV